MIDKYDVGSAFCRKARRHGGALILVKQGIEYEILYDLNNMSIEIDIEIAAIKIVRTNVVIVCLYRSPDGNMETFMDTLYEILKLVTQYHTRLLIAGDFNVNFLNKTTCRDKLFISIF